MALCPRTVNLPFNRFCGAANVRYVGPHCSILKCGERQQRAGSSPYELALNSNFSGHNYALREKRFEL
jgi:hypothetical protein